MSPYKISQLNTNTVRLYNNSGSTQNLKLNVTLRGSAKTSSLSLAGTSADVDTQSTVSSLWINKTGSTGNFLKLEKLGVDKFVVDINGNVTTQGNLTVGGNLNIGVGTTGDKVILANNADSAKPFMKYNDTGKQWEYSNDGTNSAPIGNSYMGGFKNKLINGNFDIWQRGTGVTTAAGYISDRWYAELLNSSYTAMVPGSYLRSTDAPTGSTYSLSVSNGTGATVSHFILEQRIESSSARALAGKTATISFYVKRIAAITGGTLQLKYLANTAPDVISGVSLRDSVNGFTVLSGTQNIPTSWTKYTLSTTFPSDASNGLRVGLWFVNFSAVPISTEIFRISQIQLEEGSVSTPFEQRFIGTELQMCQRYYEKSFEMDQAPMGGSYSGYVMGFFSKAVPQGGLYFVNDTFKVVKRTIPTLVLYGVNSGATANTITSISNRAILSPTASRRGLGSFTNNCGNTWADGEDFYFNWTADAEL